MPSFITQKFRNLRINFECILQSRERRTIDLLVMFVVCFFFLVGKTVVLQKYPFINLLNPYTLKMNFNLRKLSGIFWATPM